MRVYSDLIGEAARRGEVPGAEYLANLSREIELAERLAGGPPAGKESAFGPGTQATADLVEILGALATAYRLSHGGRLRIEFIAERPQLPVAAEPVALQRAFRNVLENAIKYTPDGGEIRIRAGAAGEHAYVVVKDSGLGMSAEDRARAFDYAFRGTGAVASGAPGKGLGLAVSREILEANGGKISSPAKPGSVPGDHAPSLPEGGPMKRVVVVDDDPDLGPRSATPSRARTSRSRYRETPARRSP
jgi:signal transduction histidine kinase